MKITAAEKRWVIIFALVVLAVTTLPVLLGFWMQGSDWKFTGFFIGVEDGNSYIAKMSIGTSGGWLFNTPYTAYPQNGFLAFLPYILLGKLAAGAGQHDQLVALFQIFRWVGGFVMISATYQFVAFFIEEPRWRILGTAVATLGGGFGWMAFTGLQSIWGDRIPLEIYSPETFGFLSVFTLPHLALGRGLLLLGLLAYWRGYSTTRKTSTTILNGLLWLGLGFMQPLTVLIGWLVIGVDLIVRYISQRKGWGVTQNWRGGLVNGLIMVACSAPVVLYTVLSFLTDPFLKIWSEQNIILSPPPLDYLMAYAIILPFFTAGVLKLVRQRRVESFTLLGWVALLPLLAYFPYNLQRRLPEGIWVGLVILAVAGLGTFSFRWLRFGRIFLWTSFLTTILVFAGSIFSVLQVKTPIYRPADEISAFQSITPAGSSYPIVLAAYDTANALPAWAQARTLIGHGPESIHLKEIQPRVEKFFQQETSNNERVQLIKEFNIRYIIWGPAERKLGSWDPASLPVLNKTYQNAVYQVFEVSP